MPDDTTIAPHGGDLVDLLVPEDRREATRAEAGHLPQLGGKARGPPGPEKVGVGGPVSAASLCTKTGGKPPEPRRTTSPSWWSTPASSPTWRCWPWGPCLR